MTRFIARRCLYALASLFILSVTIFVLMRVTGDPATLLAAPEASEEDLAAIRAQFGLDQPWHVQYVTFVAGAVRGDIPVAFIVETLLGAAAVLGQPDKFDELGLTPKALFSNLTALVIEGALTTNGRQRWTRFKSTVRSG